MKSTVVIGALGAALDERFNDADAPPLGGVAGAVEYRPGLLVPALDNWGTCSMLFVTAGRRWLSKTFPALTEHQTCAGVPVLELTVGVARCSSAFGDENGNPPSPDTLAGEMDVQEDDKDRLEAAVCSAMKRLRDDHHVSAWSRGPVDVQGPEGGTVAVHVTLLVQLTRSGAAG